jgi:hypothetical protein
MNLTTKLAAAGAVAVMGLGLGAAGASAYSISGGHYTATTTTDHAFSIGGAYTYTCPASLTTSTGDADGSDETWFTPYYGGVGDCEFFGLPVTVSQYGQWGLKVAAGPDVLGIYRGEVAIPAGSSTVISMPIAGCTFTVSGPQSFSHATAGNIFEMKDVAGGMELVARIGGIAYVASGCPFSSGSDGVYDTRGVSGTGSPVDFSGVSVS